MASDGRRLSRPRLDAVPLPRDRLRVEQVDRALDEDRTGDAAARLAERPGDERHQLGDPSARAHHLNSGAASACWSMSWSEPRPLSTVAVAPPSTTTGDCARRAFSTAVTVLVRPGPAVTAATPGIPVRRAVASAAKTAVGLVAHVDDPDPRGARAGQDRRDVPAAEREQPLDALARQHLRDLVAAVPLPGGHGFTGGR